MQVQVSEICIANATKTFHFQIWFWIRGDAFPANSVALDKLNLEAAILVVAHLHIPNNEREESAATLNRQISVRANSYPKH